MASFPATVEIDGVKFSIQAPVRSENGETYQVLDPAGESLGAIEIGRDGQRLSCDDPSVKRVADEAIARRIIEVDKPR